MGWDTLCSNNDSKVREYVAVINHCVDTTFGPQGFLTQLLITASNRVHLHLNHTFMSVWYVCRTHMKVMGQCDQHSTVVHKAGQLAAIIQLPVSGEKHWRVKSYCTWGHITSIRKNSKRTCKQIQRAQLEDGKEHKHMHRICAAWQWTYCLAASHWTRCWGLQNRPRAGQGVQVARDDE